MMKSKYCFLIALLLLLVLAACDSSDDDDDSSNDDDAQVDDDSDTDDDSEGSGPFAGCEENTLPEFLSINVIVNGTPVEQPVILDTNDTLAFSIEYYDAECNFHMDNRWGILLTGPTENDAYGLPPGVADAFHQSYSLEGIGCSSEEDGPFVLQIDPNDYAVPEGTVREDPLWVTIFDACLEDSFSFLSLDFTVYPAE